MKNQATYKTLIVFKPKPETIETRLNELEAEGWELVNALPQQGGDVLLILRRERGNK